MSTQIASPERPKVIVRAWGDEPVALVAHGVYLQGKWVLVGKTEAKRPIGFPAEDVFDYDDRRFKQLCAAHSQSNKKQLERLYAEMRSENKSSIGPCNRYQYVLKSQNDEKPKITNSGSVTSSGKQ